MRKSIFIGTFLFLGLFCSMAIAAPQVEIKRQKNCNLFDVKDAVKFDVLLQDLTAGNGNLNVSITNYFGETKSISTPVSIESGKTTDAVIDLGVLEPSYYEITVRAAIGDAAPVESKMMSFGVVHLVQRTAEEARKAGSRFGLKTFQLSAPGVWWRKGEVWNLAEVVDACTKLGLQWTRHQFNQETTGEPGVIGTLDLITKYPMNAVLKVEGFPEDCFDTARYGTIVDWKSKKKKGWNRATVPLKEPYQKWLKNEIAKIPTTQNIFEIGNEVWNYMSAEEFAEWCKMSVEAIKQVRPDAKVGADPGVNEYGRKFLTAGGMDNMEIWYSHPYSFTPLPEHRIRGSLRNRRDILKRRTGKEFELYVTEYGWPIAPRDRRKHSVSEKVQAQRTTRESLMLYAEDAKTLIPHWMADREQDPTEREHWFGFFRLNQQPLPVVIAHANCARMIDGGRFVGDLWFGPGIGAMLFERGGQYTMALWALEVDKEAEVSVGVPEVVAVDLMGREKKLQTIKGNLSLQLNGDVIYLTGVNPDLAHQVVPPDQNLNPDLWSTRSDSCSMIRMSTPPIIDGVLGDWMGKKSVELIKPQSVVFPGTAKAMFAWDQKFVYLAVTISGQPSGSKSRFQLGLGVRPDRQVDMEAIYDYLFTINCTGEKGAQLQVDNPDFDKPLKIDGGSDPSGVRYAVRSAADGWTMELAIPVELLRGMPSPAPGMKISGRLTVMDAADKNKVQLVYGEDKPRLWPYLLLEEAP